MSEQLNEMKKLAGLKSLNENNQAAAVARKLMDLAGKQKKDETANMLSRIGEALVDFGEPFGPRNMKEVAERAGVDTKVLKQAIEYAQRN